MSPVFAFDPTSLALASGHFIGGRLIDDSEEPIDVARQSDAADSADQPVGGRLAVKFAENAVKASGWATRPPREIARAMCRWVDPTIQRAEDQSGCIL